MECRIIKLAVFCALPVLSACYKDSEEELFAQQPNAATPIDNVIYTPGVKSFANDVLPIITPKCLSCHAASNYASTGGNINLDGHAQVIISVNNGTFLGSIKYQSGYSPMPKYAAPLNTNQIQIIEEWISQGALNN